MLRDGSREMSRRLLEYAKTGAAGRAQAARGRSAENPVDSGAF